MLADSLLPPIFGSGPVVDRYVRETRKRTKLLMEERAADIEAGLDHLTPAALRDKDRNPND